MARISVTLVLRKRWFFWPAFWGIVALNAIGFRRDPEAAAKWLVDHAMVLKVV